MLRTLSNSGVKPDLPNQLSDAMNINYALPHPSLKTLPGPCCRPAVALVLISLMRRAGAAMLLIAGLWSLSYTAQAATTAVEAVQVPAWVERHGDRRPAQPGQLLRNGDKAFTATGSRMLLRMSDRSVIKLGEATELIMQDVESTQPTPAGPTEIKAALRLITGVFRYATDYSSKALGNKRQLSLELATATVGIRGTDFWSMTDAEHDAVCIFEGAVEVIRADKPGIALDKPGAFWVVFTGQAEQPAGQATPDQLAKFIGQAEMSPGQGVLLEGGRWRVVVALMPSMSEAAALRERLRTAGYPAEMITKGGRHEVRINQFATREDAQTVLASLQTTAAAGVPGGRVALAAE